MVFLVVGLMGCGGQTITITHAPVHPVTLDQPEAFCPVDASFYLHLKKLAAWRYRSDPLVERLWAMVEPKTRPELWHRAAQGLDLEAEDFFNACFGEEAALIELAVDDRHAAVILARPDASLMPLIPDGLGLSSVGRSGAFDLYVGQDKGSLCMAMGHGWMILTDQSNTAHLMRVLETAQHGPPLMSDADFRELRAALPDDAPVIMRRRMSSDDEQHVMTVDPRGAHTQAHYAARGFRKSWNNCRRRLSGFYLIRISAHCRRTW